jgi:hypothetical protein
LAARAATIASAWFGGTTGSSVPLEEGDRHSEAIGKIHQRPLVIAGALCRVRASQPVEIARFEFVCIPRQRFEIADAVTAGSSTEYPHRPAQHRGLSRRQRSHPK